MEALKRQCINLIVDESLNTDSRAEYIATLLINGTGAAPLKEMTEEVLVQEVYDRCSYRFTSDEADSFADNNEELRKWIMATKATDWCATSLY
jgi:hypothetical protein